MCLLQVYYTIHFFCFLGSNWGVTVMHICREETLGIAMDYKSEMEQRIKVYKFFYCYYCYEMIVRVKALPESRECSDSLYIDKASELRRSIY